MRSLEVQPWMTTWHKMMRPTTEVLLMLVMAKVMELAAQETMMTEAMEVMAEDLATMSAETEEVELVALALLRNCSSDRLEQQEGFLELKQPRLLRPEQALDSQHREQWLLPAAEEYLQLRLEPEFHRFDKVRRKASQRLRDKTMLKLILLLLFLCILLNFQVLYRPESNLLPL